MTHNYRFVEKWKTDIMCRAPGTELGTINTTAFSFPQPLMGLYVLILEPGWNNSFQLDRGMSAGSHLPFPFHFHLVWAIGPRSSLPPFHQKLWKPRSIFWFRRQLLLFSFPPSPTIMLLSLIKSFFPLVPGCPESNVPCKGVRLFNPVGMGSGQGKR